jgi:hypothetical protein
MSAMKADDNTIVCAGYKCSSVMAASIEPFIWIRKTKLSEKHPQVAAWDAPGERLAVLCENAVIMFLSWPEMNVIGKTRLPIWAMPVGSGDSLIIDSSSSLRLVGSDILPPGMIVCRLDFRPEHVMHFPLGRGLALHPAAGAAYMSDSVFGKVVEIDPIAGKSLRRMDVARGVGIGGLDAGRNLLIAANYFSGYVDFFSLQSGRSTGRAYVGRRVRRVEVDEKTGRIFASSELGVMELNMEKILGANSAGR